MKRNHKVWDLISFRGPWGRGDLLTRIGIPNQLPEPAQRRKTKCFRQKLVQHQARSQFQRQKKINNNVSKTLYNASASVANPGGEGADPVLQFIPICSYINSPTVRHTLNVEGRQKTLSCNTSIWAGSADHDHEKQSDKP